MPAEARTERDQRDSYNHAISQSSNASTAQTYPFNVEWLPESSQVYHGPRKRMREILDQYSPHDREISTQSQVLDYLIKDFSNLAGQIRKIKFYIIDDSGKILRFFIIWCDHDVDAREGFFEAASRVVSKTGWYPLVTGNRAFHHNRELTDFMEIGLRKAMNKANIEKLPGLGSFKAISNFYYGEGVSILLQSSVYDIVLDAGMTENELSLSKLRSDSRKWLFMSHSHLDHTGGAGVFINDRKFVISASPLTLELLLSAISNTRNIPDSLPKNFFYRFAPMWYRTRYVFSDGSSIETVPTYHFPGSMGFVFTFSDGKTVFYSGDLNVSASYVARMVNRLEPYPGTSGAYVFDAGRRHIDYGILDGTFVGRKIGSTGFEVESLLETIESSLTRGRNHLILTPPRDYGFFTFIHLYDDLISASSRRVEARVFLDPVILEQAELLEWRLKRKRKGELDDAFVSFLNSRVTLAESVRVYDITKNLERNLQKLDERHIRVVAILDDKRYSDRNYVSSKALACLKSPGLDISRVGKAATQPMTGYLSETSLTDFDSGIWLLHSREELLRDYILSGKQEYAHVFLFHNFKGRIERFIKTVRAAGYTRNISALT